jgi:hypothetical protein
MQKVIGDVEAKRIADKLAKPLGPLATLAACGAIDLRPVMLELDGIMDACADDGGRRPEWDDAARLGSYVLEHGPRDMVPGWGEAEYAVRLLRDALCAVESLAHAEVLIARGRSPKSTDPMYYSMCQTLESIRDIAKQAREWAEVG